jgi:hypothetical protein
VVDAANASAEVLVRSALACSIDSAAASGYQAEALSRKAYGSLSAATPLRACHANLLKSQELF